MKPKRLSRTVIYENPWVNLYTDKVQFPDGQIIDKHHILEFEKEAVANIVENDQGQVLLVHAYRYPTNSIEWEIPAGAIEPGESILAAGQREVLEETGYGTTNPELIYTYYPQNGISNQIFHIIGSQATEKLGDFDRNEVESWKWVSLTDIQTMIKHQQIQDGYTLTALLLHLSNQI